MWNTWAGEEVKRRQVVQLGGPTTTRSYMKHTPETKRLFKTYVHYMGEAGAKNHPVFANIPTQDLRRWANDPRPLPGGHRKRRLGGGKKSPFTKFQMNTVFHVLADFRKVGPVTEADIATATRRLLPPPPQKTTYPNFEYSKDWARAAAELCGFDMQIESTSRMHEIYATQRIE